MWWNRNKALILEVFINANFAFLTLDIYLAHSFNTFRQWAEWIPFWFSMIAAVSLFVALIRRNRSESVWRWTGFLVGTLSIVVGMAGMLFHLDSHFFTAQTIKSLKPPLEGRDEYFDTSGNPPGFGLRITSRGVRTSFLSSTGPLAARRRLGEASGAIHGSDP